jgi:hypothetical protein
VFCRSDMPIQPQIDHGLRLVIARLEGVVTVKEVFAYQTEIWSRPDVMGYNELVDMRNVTNIEMPSPNRDQMKHLAWLAATMDKSATPTKFAILAPDNLTFGYSQMYAAFRNVDQNSPKRVSVFRKLDEALEFLGLSALPDPAPPESSGGINR